MKKLKLYLDTSTISHLDQHDASDKMQDTLRFWKDVEKGQYDIFLSYICFDELLRCSHEKRMMLAEYISRVSYTHVSYSNEIYTLANEFVTHGILKQSSFDDAQHLASAMVSECDAIISLNFKHMVNVKTIGGIKIVAAITRYRETAIYTPTMLLGGDNNDS